MTPCRAGQLPIDEQVTQFRAALAGNGTLTEVLARAAGMGLPGWYLVAGCLYQTVLNGVTGRRLRRASSTTTWPTSTTLTCPGTPRTR